MKEKMWIGESMYGYHGKILKVDLSDGSVKTIELKEDLAKAFIGGSGLAARLLFDVLDAKTNPLGPDNHLAFMTGPFTATPVPQGSRYIVAGKSAQGFWGEACSGGSFGPALKGAGVDGVIITGAAKKPVYLFVHDSSVEIKDASHLWGKDTIETQEIIKKDLGERRIRVACIGIGGENKVKYASIMNDESRAAGRCGLGAVMGAKNLKAVAAVGDARAEIASEEMLRGILDFYKLVMEASPFYHLLREYGTYGYLDMAFEIGDAPTRYFTRALFPVEKVSSATFKDTYMVRNYACYGCPVACGKVVEYNKRGVKEIDTPEYETMVAFGPLLENYDLDSILYVNHLCNIYGIDTISAGVSIAFAFYLYEKGVIGKKDVGMKLEWGNSETIVKLVEMVAKRSGFGNILAEGTKGMAERLNVDPGEAANVKGLEIPMHDPRAFFGQALSYATGNRGACHLRGDFYQVDLGVGAIPELGIIQMDRFVLDGRVDAVAKYQDVRELYDSLILCKFSFATLSMICDFLNAITGWDYNPESIHKTGERIFNIKRALNNKFGVTREHDKMPRIAIAPLEEGATAGKTPNMEELLKEYYKARKWDWETGKPTKEKLEELGLGDIAAKIWK
ncbi:MAG: aldehyde ferredoxin oxidoreductase family protein [Candidatus Jordarchaeales archaeon]